MNARIWLAAAIIAGGALGIIALQAGAQQPVPVTPLATVVVQTADGTLVEQTVDGKVLRTTTPPQAGNAYPAYPASAANGLRYSIAGPVASDPESIQMASQEQSAAQEARALAAQYAQADSDETRTQAKAKLREKLETIFALQQKRRAFEIGKIEERLAKLKETMEKRDANKDPIVDRRLDQLTGGVDELGWEESGGVTGAGASPYGLPNLPVPQPNGTFLPADPAPRGLPLTTPPNPTIPAIEPPPVRSAR